MRLSKKTLKWVLKMVEADMANVHHCDCVKKKLKQMQYVLKEYIKDPKD